MFLQKQTANLQAARAVIKKDIDEGNARLKDYTDQIQQIQDNIEEKTNKVLVENAFKIIVKPSDNENQEEQQIQANKHADKYWKQRSKVMEYKHAFGQRIPIHYEWKVK